MRIYTVHDRETDQTRLVEASTQAQAIHYVVHNRYSASAATAMQVADAMQSGVKLERACKATPDSATPVTKSQPQTLFDYELN